MNSWVVLGATRSLGYIGLGLLGVPFGSSLAVVAIAVIVVVAAVVVVVVAAIIITILTVFIPIATSATATPTVIATFTMLSFFITTVILLIAISSS